MKREERERRIARAEELLIEHPSSSSACVSALMAEIGISERAAWRYVKVARERWAQEAEELGAESRAVARERMRRTLRHVQGRGFKANDLRAVLGATKQIRALDGLDVPKELRLSGAVGVVDASSFAERSTEDILAFIRTGRMPPEVVDTGDD